MVIGQSLLLVLLGYLGTPSRAILAVTTTSKDFGMKERFEAECPLCTSLGSFIFTDKDNYKAYLCDDCGRYEISTRAEKQVRDLPPERRAIYSQLVASAPAGQILEISFEVLTTGNRINHRYISALE
ncbi:hypothetical protein [Serratia quinivorans]|uniref:hypothetical protein n=1 Tax=Serratia quinivorans TaxID=137545 RepID=UPI0021BD028A|nr:hypothetical protein [Serratia quinivorans]